MKMTVVAQGYATLREVPPKMLEPGKLYSTVTYEIDDATGDSSMSTDMVFCHLDIIEGKKNIRVMRFLMANKTKRYSQIVGTRFFGPMNLAVTDTEAPAIAPGMDIEAILAKATSYQQPIMGFAVNEDNVVLPTSQTESPVDPACCPSCGKKNGTLQAPANLDDSPMYWCDPASGGCDEVWEAKL